MATIRDVAQLAGVSTATVSHVLNGTRPVLEPTRRQVMDAIDRLNYHPNGLARSLVINATHTIGVIVADITNPFFGAIVKGLEERVRVHGYSLVVCNTDEQPEREALDLELLINRRVDGLVIAPTGASQPLFDDLVRQGAAMVFLDRKPAEPYGPFVGIDNAAAGYEATQYLLRRGHRRIGMLVRNPSLSTVGGRASGYRRALAEYGVSTDESLIEVARGTIDDATDSALRLLRRDPRLTAIITGNHVMTLGLIGALAMEQIEYPRDISVVGFDDHPWAAFHTPPLTVMAQPISQICDSVTGSLLGTLWSRGRRPDGVGQPLPMDESGEVLLSARLIERDSVRSLVVPPNR